MFCINPNWDHLTLAEELEKLINLPFQEKEGNRKIAFEKVYKLCLHPLPTNRYMYSDCKEPK